MPWRTAFSATLALALALTIALNTGHANADAPAAQLGDGEPRTALLLALSHFHNAPTQQQLEALPLSDVASALMEVAADQDVLDLRRVRAISSLRFYPSTRLKRFIESQVAVEADNPNAFVLGRLLRLAAVELGDYDVAWSLALIEPFAEHENPAIREHVKRGQETLRAYREGPLQ